MSTAPLLEVEDLSVSFKTKRGYAAAVRNLSYSIRPGESVAIVGESGSGKSVSAMALLGLLPPTAQVTGSAQFDLSTTAGSGEQTELIGAKPSALRKIRGNRISMIFQDPMTAFNPVFTIGDQIGEIITTHHSSVSKKEAEARAVDLLASVGIPFPDRRVKQYPHEFSGGMRQRAMIAMAIANDPTLLIADEPTTALDVTIQAQVMETLAEARERTGAAMILITHDLGLVAGSADRVMVMYGGRIFEKASTRDLFYRPMNPYTRGLMRSIPRLDGDPEDRLDPIPGTPPSILNMPVGCAFQPRCVHREDICAEMPAELTIVGPDHESRCHRTASLPSADEFKASVVS